MTTSFVPGFAERRFQASGLQPSIDVPVRTSPPIRRVVKGVGEVGPGLSEAPRSIRVIWPRLMVNAVGTFVSAMVASLLMLALTPAVLGYDPVVVMSGSMGPALRTSDVVVLGQPVGRYPVGAVIDFRTGDGSRIHRIVEVTDSGYRTKGDANPTPDIELVADTDVRGVGMMVVPLVGIPQVLIAQGLWAQLVGLILVLAIALRVTPRRWVMSGQTSDMSLSFG